MRSFLRRWFFYRHSSEQTTRGSIYQIPFLTRRRMGSSTVALLYALAVSPSPTSSKPEDAGNKSHHLKSGFTNPWDSWNPLGGAMFRMLRRQLTGQAHRPDTTPPTVPVQAPEFLPSRETPTLRATWLGHACYYVEFPNGLRVLFDPVFEDRCSPLSWLGPKRYTDPPCQIKDIPIIDAVVISHCHYDHLSLPTVKEIHERHPNCHFFAPLGNKAWFTSIGITKMTELDWWDDCDLVLSPTSKTDESKSLVDIKAKIGCLPCQHASGRGIHDQYKTLWASWYIESGGRKVYFAGDTGYRTVPVLPDDVDDHAPEYDYPSCPVFKQVGEFRGPFDLGLIPIGAYKPRFFMSRMHADPHDAVEIFRDTQCKNGLAIHWGTWVLTEEDVLEPPRLLKEALKKHGYPETGVFDTCAIGETREY